MEMSKRLMISIVSSAARFGFFRVPIYAAILHVLGRKASNLQT